MIYEIRNYHFLPDKFDAYKSWAKQRALPYLKRELNLIGFWTNIDAPSEVLGVPNDSLGVANITWIIGWNSLEERNETMARVFASDEWKGIFAHVPGGLDSYLRRESKFTESLV
jgi:hypothetical protein